MHGKKVLIVDDSQVDLRMLSLKLDANGYEVLRVEDGATAVNVARREKPDLILLDISFPPEVVESGGVLWDSFLILSWLRRLEEAKDIPVILVSGKDRAQTEPRALQAGAACYFQKPVNCDDLLKAIQHQLNGSTKGCRPKKRILMVDDEGDWRFVARSCLEDAGFEVVTAKDLTEALKRLATTRPDGIVLDLNLAGENGLLVMELLKEKHPGIPILIYTGYQHDEQAVQQMLRQGARKYLRKGSMTELCNTLRSMVN
jgi:CheY-like chemotaxis protein